MSRIAAVTASIVRFRNSRINRFRDYCYMDIREAKIVPDLRVFTALNISREHGRKRLKELEKQGIIDPLRTPTGRTLLSFEEAERLSAAI